MMYPIIIPMSHSGGPWPLNVWGTITLFLTLVALLGVAIVLSVWFVNKVVDKEYSDGVSVPAIFVFVAITVGVAVVGSGYASMLVHSLTGGL